MDVVKAHSIVSALANGVNPTTGEVFPSDSPYQSPAIIRALFIASRMMATNLALPAQPAKAVERARSPRSAGSNVGKAWSPEDDQLLLEEFAAGRSPSELAKLLSRTLAGIEARLEKHGRITAQERTTANRYTREQQSIAKSEDAEQAHL